MPVLHSKNHMSNTRREYFEDLLTDCLDAAASAGIETPAEVSRVVAAMIIADSLNGLRKALKFPATRDNG